MKNNYCKKCGESLKTELDFIKDLENIILLKKCKNCGNVVDKATIKNVDYLRKANPYD